MKKFMVGLLITSCVWGVTACGGKDVDSSEFDGTVLETHTEDMSLNQFAFELANKKDNWLKEKLPDIESSFTEGVDEFYYYGSSDVNCQGVEVRFNADTSLEDIHDMFKKYVLKVEDMNIWVVDDWTDEISYSRLDELEEYRVAVFIYEDQKVIDIFINVNWYDKEE